MACYLIVVPSHRNSYLVSSRYSHGKAIQILISYRISKLFIKQVKICVSITERQVIPSIPHPQRYRSNVMAEITPTPNKNLPIGSETPEPSTMRPWLGEAIDRFVVGRMYRDYDLIDSWLHLRPCLHQFRPHYHCRASTLRGPCSCPIEYPSAVWSPRPLKMMRCTRCWGIPPKPLRFIQQMRLRMSPGGSGMHQRD